ncbi:hypothetical protein [Metabacillus endolithicus]|nr:hypothetical protein [Metabacillus endolithicus]
MIISIFNHITGTYVLIYLIIMTKTVKVVPAIIENEQNEILLL